MDRNSIYNKTYESTSSKEILFNNGEFEKCTFKNCDFSACDLSEILFIDCEIIGCDLTLAKLVKTGFQNVSFSKSKMLGLLFYNSNEFGLSFTFDDCLLNHSSFYKMKIKKTLFKNTQLLETDFTECDLTNSIFSNCDLTKAIFENTILEKSDFRTSFNYTIDPEKNRIRKAKFSLPQAVRLLSKYNIEIDN